MTGDPRIHPVEDVDEEVRELLSKTLARDGEPLNVFATLAHHPRLLGRFNALGGLFLARGLLPARIRELVVLRVAWRTGSVYEWGQHVLIGGAVGLSADEVLSVASERPWEGDPAESCALAVADELLDRDDVANPVWSVARARFDEAQLLELLCLVGFYRMLAGVLNAVRVQPEPHLSGWPEAASLT